MKLRLVISLLAMSLPLSAASAEVAPVPGEGDPRIQTVDYDPQQVVALHIVSGYAVTLRFSPEERIETVTLGDPASWQVAVNKRADSLVLKPMGPALPTNLTVISDQRSYVFALYRAADTAALQPYLITFRYPAEPTRPSAETATVTSQYQLRGDRSLWPLAISDDGTFTSLRWSDGASLPAVYRQDGKGNISLVNGLVREGAYVIEGVPTQLVFVLGKTRATATRLEAGKTK